MNFSGMMSEMAIWANLYLVEIFHFVTASLGTMINLFTGYST